MDLNTLAIVLMFWASIVPIVVALFAPEFHRRRKHMSLQLKQTSREIS